MSFLYIVNRIANLFARTGSVVSVSPAAVTAGPSAAIFDGDPSTPHVSSGVSSGSTSNALTNPGFETSTLVGWTSADSGGTSSETTTAGQFRSGSKALKLFGNYASRYQDISVTPGESRTASFWAKTAVDGVNGYIRNLTTGNYLHNDGTWSSGRSAWGSVRNGVAFGQATLSYVVETSAGATALLRWEVANDSGGGTGYVDDCSDVGSECYRRVQHNAITNPGFETPTLSGWTTANVGTGTAVETTTAGEFRSGSRALELTGTDASNYGSVSQLVTVLSGEWRKATVYMRAIGAGTGKLFLKNLKTGNYYNGSAWASARAAAASASATTAFPGVATTVTYQVESFDSCQDDSVSLRWELACESGDVCFDDCLDVPGVTWASIHGHNYGPVTPLVQSSDDGSAWTTRATMTKKSPAFYSPFSIIFAEYWQVLLSGVNHEAPYEGEIVLSQYQTSTAEPEWNPVIDREIPGSRQFGTALRPTAYVFSKDAAESIGMTFLMKDAAAERDLYDKLWLRSAGGKYPVIVVPRSDEAAVYFGHLMKPYSSSRPFQDARAAQLYLSGSPFPTLGR